MLYYTSYLTFHDIKIYIILSTQNNILSIFDKTKYRLIYYETNNKIVNINTTTRILHKFLFSTRELINTLGFWFFRNIVQEAYYGTQVISAFIIVRRIELSFQNNFCSHANQLYSVSLLNKILSTKKIF